jgi:hypothetical protein
MPEERTARPGGWRLRRHVRAVIAVVVAALVVSLAMVWVSDPAHLAPHELDLWGHAFTADGNAYVLETGQGPPWPNEPISLAEVQRRDPNPVIVHQTSGPFLIGLTVVPMPKPFTAPKARAIYLQVGSDAYIPYYWANNCCEPTW